ncbi:MAG: hypothetical protein ACO34E_05390 [Limisphaerales bacterium]
MQQERKRQRGAKPLTPPCRTQGSALWHLAALLALGAFLVVTLLSWSPQLHELFHDHDEPGTSHECAVSLLAHGQIALHSSEAPLSLPPVTDYNPPPAGWFTPAVNDLRLTPGRAPPQA